MRTANSVRTKRHTKKRFFSSSCSFVAFVFSWLHLFFTVQLGLTARENTTFEREARKAAQSTQGIARNFFAVFAGFAGFAFHRCIHTR